MNFTYKLNAQVGKVKLGWTNSIENLVPTSNYVSDLCLKNTSVIFVNTFSLNRLAIKNGIGIFKYHKMIKNIFLS